jgi:hypothetical protein
MWIVPFVYGTEIPVVFGEDFVEHSPRTQRDTWLFKVMSLGLIGEH